VLEEVREARPGRSSPEPTWYHVFATTIGVEWSSCRITCSPFGSVSFSNCSFGTPCAAAGIATVDAINTQDVTK
jgi:hypothetical protein